ncbi:MAG TPA: hypothetical protein VJT71_17905 [Pyrinomonadaceae bacterium]|nr:hypothetical protein [Pyrinomonadaceae bacterium]
MNVLKPLRRVRIVFVTLPLCVLLASLLAQSGASHGLRMKPSVELHASSTKIVYPCPPSGRSISGTCPTTADFQVALTVKAKDFNKQPRYVYAVNGGRVTGEGSSVIWDLNGVAPGVYTATVEVQDGKKRRAESSVAVRIEFCSDCVICDGLCPTIIVTCYNQVKAGTPITCALKPGDRFDPITHQPYTYQWSARDSDDNDLSATISRQGEYVSIPTKGLGGKAVITTVTVKELDPSCNRTAQGITLVKP